MAGKPPLPRVACCGPEASPDAQPVGQRFRETEAAGFDDGRVRMCGRRSTRPILAAVVLVLALVLALAFLGCAVKLVMFDMRRDPGEAPAVVTTQAATDDAAFNEVMREVLR